MQRSLEVISIVAQNAPQLINDKIKRELLVLFLGLGLSIPPWKFFYRRP